MVRRRKSTSPNCRPAASPSRRPAKAHTATKRMEVIRCLLQRRADLLGSRDPHLPLRLGDTRWGDPRRRILPDHPRLDGREEGHADVVVAGAPGRGREPLLSLRPRLGHGLHPGLDVQLGDPAHRHVGKGDRGQRHGRGLGGAVSPPLHLRPPPEPLPEGDLPGRRVDIVTSDNSGRDFIEPSLGIGLLDEVPGVLLACLVTVAGAIALDRDRLLFTGLLVDDDARGDAFGDAGHASSCADPPTSPRATTCLQGWP